MSTRAIVIFPLRLMTNSSFTSSNQLHVRCIGEPTLFPSTRLTGGMQQSHPVRDRVASPGALQNPQDPAILSLGSDPRRTNITASRG
ncbi:hypothetical protein DSO57_1001225 [Entomophthora muscae]|uniref:Uncharacterized protein n=1 Tax=Entomophthora muscae TaxID=34485 RepID=A0ACC2SLN4_9FUNG|nr:hypothetical protein DSO57_1001225 [Entomophthora muscae]